ncbi:hypothetical protein BDV19DRAFT_383649 [Aspergillus venezuelensis]
MASGAHITATPPRTPSVSSQPTTCASQTASARPLTQKELDEKPWKYIGYRGYSIFLASDSDFCNFRRFERLNTRVILALQDEISQIEESLDEIDRCHSSPDAPDVNNGSFRQDTQQAHRYVSHYIQLKTRASAAEKDIQSLKNWFYNHDGAIIPEERKYIEKDDLFALVPKDRSPLRRLFEQSSRFRLSRLWKRKELKSELPLHVQQNINYSSDKRIDQFVTATTVVTGLVMLIMPIWVLAYTDPVALKLAVITIFIFLFLALVLLGTHAKTYKLLAATAAYSAILMVFLQLGNSGSK